MEKIRLSDDTLYGLKHFADSLSISKQPIEGLSSALKEMSKITSGIESMYDCNLSEHSKLIGKKLIDITKPNYDQLIGSNTTLIGLSSMLKSLNWNDETSKIEIPTIELKKHPEFEYNEDSSSNGIQTFTTKEFEAVSTYLDLQSHPSIFRKLKDGTYQVNSETFTLITYIILLLIEIFKSFTE